jgi:hypothetical protein
MNFTWIDNSQITWETDLFKRAPKICQIQISFEPVHDIAPGIDHTGINRAPVYQVGDSSQQLAGNLWGDTVDEDIQEYEKQQKLLGKTTDVSAALANAASALTRGGS